MATSENAATVPYATVLKAEEERIEKIRAARREACESDVPDGAALTGLALSGGGIRSAAFALGVLHSLLKRQILYRLDYLSTVSGGGYIGAAWTYLETLSASGDLSERDKVLLNLGNRAVGAKSEGTERDEDGNARIKGAEFNRHLDHVRAHGNYISQGARLGIGSVLAMVLRSISVGLVIWLPLAALVFATACLLIDLPQGMLGLAQPIEDEALPDSGTHVFGDELAWLAVPGIVVLALLVVRSVRQSCGWQRRRPSKPYEGRIDEQRDLGDLLKWAAGFFVVASLPGAVRLLDWLGGSIANGTLIASVTSLVGGLSAFFGFFGLKRRTAGGLDLTSIGATIGAALLLYGGLVLALLLAHHVVTLAHVLLFWLEPLSQAKMARAALLGWGILLALGWLSIRIAKATDLNVIALHRLYRDRLMETFMPNPADEAAGVKARSVGEWHPATRAERLWLHDASPKKGIGPYHLLNTNVVLVRSRSTRYSGRGGDSFVLSPLHCGSDATGWCCTQGWIRFRVKGEEDDHLSLATAMAVSGAAVNPNAAVAGQGATRNRFVSLVMSLLNLRLACWVPNPHWCGGEGAGHRYTPAPTWWMPGRQMLTGRAHDEHEPFIELSDGGHFENLGIYELVRRRVRTIIVTDAGCDPRFCFADLGNAIERCRVDFGVDIRFRDVECDLSRLISLAGGESAFDKTFPLAKSGVAIARISYPRTPDEEACIGHLVYVKATLTRDLPADVYAYKLANPSFPHQSTGDQWFDEAQFEAYRELGYGLFENFFDDFVAAQPANDSFDYAELAGWLKGGQPPIAAAASAQ